MHADLPPLHCVLLFTRDATAAGAFTQVNGIDLQTAMMSQKFDQARLQVST